jgi:hypothetical protein
MIQCHLFAHMSSNLELKRAYPIWECINSISSSFFLMCFEFSWCLLIYFLKKFFAFFSLFFGFTSHELWLPSTQIVGAFNVITIMFVLRKSWFLFAICFTQINKLCLFFNISCELQSTFLFYVNSLLFMLSIIVVHVCVFTQLFFSCVHEHVWFAQWKI